MDKYTFKRTTKLFEDWGQDVHKGYTPQLNGEALPYFIDRCPYVGDWSVWEAYGEGEHVCGGLTLADAKQQFIKYYNSKK